MSEQQVEQSSKGSRSASIDLIATALAKIQGAISSVPKLKSAKIEGDRANYNYDYADLPAVWNLIRSHLAANGIAVVQDPSSPAEGAVSVVTLLLHSSGQWIESSPLIMPVSRAGPQAYGSAVTYARRYSLCAMLGVVSDDEDDDAQAAEGDRSAKPAGKPAAQRAAPPPAATGKQRFISAIDRIEEAKTSNNKPFWRIFAADGSKYSTFDRTFHDYATGAIDIGKPVELEFTRGKFGNELTAIYSVPEAEA